MAGHSGWSKSALLILWMANFCCVLWAQSKPFDGDWWMASTAAEQEGFILGYGDCFADPDSMRVRMLMDDATLRIAISDYYQSHAAQRARPAAEVLKDIWSGHTLVRGSEKAQPGQGWRARHGFFDGGWWKGSNAAERLGFVEGYTSCVNSGKNKAAHLQLSPAAYVQWVDVWYAGEGDQEVSAERQGVKITDVLLRVGNHPVPGAH
jgi:hypothetical protein